MSQPPTRIQNNRLKTLFQEMVDIYSPSGKEEEIVVFLTDWLKQAGLPVTLREVTEGRHNIEVVWPDAQPDVAFFGHVDTVPAFDIERYEFDERDGLAYGLGTADMKGGCAAMIEAFLSFVENGNTPQRAGLFLVVGEEESGDGTAALLDGWNYPWALIAEPTNLVPCLNHYSYVEMLIRAFGTRRHASMAGHDYNAIFSMLRMLLRVAEWIEQEHPEIILNIRDLHSSESGFAVPDRCASWLDLHIPWQTPLDQLSDGLKTLVQDSLSGSAVTHYEIGFPTLAQGYQLPQEGLLPELLHTAYQQLNLPWEPGAFHSHSDANLLWNANCKPVILGPGQLAKAHTRDESISLAEVERAAGIYLEILDTLHGSPCRS
ncbi:M20 family metallopeptidase [Planctomycetota bacterium]